jgi:hypothetical protein
MSEPEIARRCSVCGVTLRQLAMFCPQCGNDVPQAATTTVATAPETIAETAPRPQVHGDGVRGRVEKLRKVSSIVIDQAAYDPSLRFVLVATALFLLFLILLILNKVLS